MTRSVALNSYEPGVSLTNETQVEKEDLLTLLHARAMASLEGEIGPYYKNSSLQVGIKANDILGRSKDVLDSFQDITSLPIAARSIKLQEGITIPSRFDEVFNIMGVFNLLTSFLQIFEGGGDVTAAYKRDDNLGMLYGMTKGVKGLVQTLTGLPWIPYQIYKIYQRTVNNTPVNQAFLIAPLQSALSFFYYLLTILPLSLRLYFGLDVGFKMQSIMRDFSFNDREKIQHLLHFLENEMRLYEKDFQKAIAWAEKNRGKKVSESTKGNRLFLGRDLTHFEKLYSNKCKDPEFMKLAVAKLVRLRKTKEAQLKRSIGYFGFAALKRELNIREGDRLSVKLGNPLDKAAFKEGQKLAQAILRSHLMQTLVNALTIFSAVAGCGLLVASIFISSPISILVLGVISLTISGVTLLCGLFDLSQAFLAGEEGRYEKAVLLLGGTILGAMISLAFFFAASPASYLLIGSILSLWILLSLFILAVSLYKRMNKGSCHIPEIDNG